MYIRTAFKMLQLLLTINFGLCDCSFKIIDELLVEGLKKMVMLIAYFVAHISYCNETKSLVLTGSLLYLHSPC